MDGGGRKDISSRARLISHFCRQVRQNARARSTRAIGLIRQVGLHLAYEKIGLTDYTQQHSVSSRNGILYLCEMCLVIVGIEESL